MNCKNQKATPEDLVAAADTGSRNSTGFKGRLLWVVPFCWALFQLWYASPLPFIFKFGIFNDTQARSIHLAFAMFLAFIAFPATKKANRSTIPVLDLVLACVGCFAAAYICIFYNQLAERAGAPIFADVLVSVIGMILLLEATRRALGPPLMVVALVFLTYTFAGPYMPDIIAHSGASINKAMSHLWLSTEGVFGVALGVSTSFVFLFVLLGSLLERAGAGAYFINVAFSCLGHMRGGPAKAAVVASGLSGIISGSSIANVVTTGTFTIPLMKKVGFPDYKAGAVEVAASTNGQLTPPIMGAAAFLMVEYVGISYVEVIRAALLPALISYIALLFIVHLEACKAGMEGLKRKKKKSLAQSLLSFVGTILLLLVLSAITYYGVGWIKVVFQDYALLVLLLLLFSVYLVCLKISIKYPQDFDLNAEITEIPETFPTVCSGLHFLLPIVVLVWCLMIERFSPGLSAFWSACFMVFIILTQHPIIAFFNKSNLYNVAIKKGIYDLGSSLVTGSRNMIGIGVATAAAGIVVGVVTLTGVGLVMTDLVEFISGGSVILMLFFTAIISLILGMGLPTTANYIVVSTLMAPVIVTLGAQHGLIIPLIAVHLFVFYFGILADDTPPVGLAAFAAAAIAKSDPIKTGVQGFIYDIRTAILPFMFVFNTQLLLLDISSWWQLAITVFSAILAMLSFSAATQGWFITKNKCWETLLLLLVTFALFRPGFFWDKIYAPHAIYSPQKIEEVAAKLPIGANLTLLVAGENLDGNHISKIVTLPTAKAALTGAEKIASTGLELSKVDSKVVVDLVAFDSVAEKAGIEFDWEIKQVITASARPMKEWVFVPTLLLLFFVCFSQFKRKNKIA